ncbi:OmpP1/FadL family transporter [Dyadobacter sp.]|uniref:OmpP1/FadL family transporter n=1 Tax=Dyadobacter sp. TaxID=1914288 RepID=UPI003F6F008A
MSQYSKVLLLTLTLGLGWSCANLNAQGLGNSPYSSLGIGEFYGDAYSDNSGMGQSGVSTASGFQINNLNPALWVRNRFTTLDVGLVTQYKDITAGSDRQTNFGANLAYLSLSFPVKPRWVIGVNLKPYSFVDYQNEAIKPVIGTASVARYITSGKGGINKASITNSVQINKYISVGLESSYFFGNARRSSDVNLVMPGENPDDNYLVSLNQRTTYSDIAFRAGAAVRIPIKKENKLNLNLGGAYSFSTSLNAENTTTFELTQDSFPVTLPDTLNNNQSGSLTIPEQYQVGASLEWPFKLILSADYSRQSWSQYRNYNNLSESLRDVNRIHLGAEYLPRFTSLNYFNLVRYRLGFSYGNTPYVVAGRNVNDTNISLGFTFPMGRGYQNFLSFALIGGQRGNSGAGQVKERYGRAVLGITLLERWFVKQKLD